MVTKDTRLQSFQFKILHRIIACNKWLCQIKILEDPTCNFCDEEDDIVHFFIKCQISDNFWKRFADWLQNTLEINFKFSHYDILFGYTGDNKHKEVINYCLIKAKFHIYVEKLLKKPENVNILHYLYKLKNDLIVKSEQAILNKMYEKFYYTWGIVFEKI